MLQSLTIFLLVEYRNTVLQHASYSLADNSTPNSMWLHVPKFLVRTLPSSWIGGCQFFGKGLAIFWHTPCHILGSDADGDYLTYGV